jgi:2-amino-4-hydroxy-6-hydroxymethyldihydropteridine diphosphokinase
LLLVRDYASLKGEKSLPKVYIGLGANLGNKTENIKNAVNMLENIEGLSITRASSLYLTEPWGDKNQEKFINQVVEAETELAPLDLLYRMQDIEIKLGRQRSVKWGPRVIDIDLLLYGKEKINMKELQVPHPYLRERLFVLIPLQEICPEMKFPDGSTITEVVNRIRALAGGNDVIKLNVNNLPPVS